MTNIVLFVRDFQKGAELSEKLNSINLNVNVNAGLPIDKVESSSHDIIINKNNKKEFMITLNNQNNIPNNIPNILYFPIQ